VRHDRLERQLILLAQIAEGAVTDPAGPSWALYRFLTSGVQSGHSADPPAGGAPFCAQGGNMVRRIIGGTALAAALTLGVAGVAGAGAATPSSGASGSTTPAACSRLPKLEARVQKFDNAVKARLPKAEAREAKLRAAGHDKLADAIATRITKVQARETKINARLSKAEAKCGSSGSSDSSASTGNTL
jgi:hypothetical protein